MESNQAGFGPASGNKKTRKILRLPFQLPKYRLPPPPVGPTKLAAVFPGLILIEKLLAPKPNIRPRKAVLPRYGYGRTYERFLHQIGSDGKSTHVPNDPFSRARLPYLHSSPARPFKTSMMEYAEGWDTLRAYRYLSIQYTHLNYRHNDADSPVVSRRRLRDRFNACLERELKTSIFPHHQVLVPQIEAIANLVFQKDMIYAHHALFSQYLHSCTTSKAK